ncbi:MAG: monooxygenase [Betaproteobacteria bacterium]|nr:monooxygenase [Betaproteobacteria bacterium]
MITVIVQFKLSAPLPRADTVQRFMSAAPIYQAMPGLIRKYYALSDDGVSGAGIYLWESRAAAERAHNEEWRERNTKKFGEPVMTWYDCPMVVDNLTGEVIVSKSPADPAL